MVTPSQLKISHGLRSLFIFCLSSLIFQSVWADWEEELEHRFVDNDGVKIHYISAGATDKPLLVFIHGFPDYWYSWRFQIAGLFKEYHVVAMDTRGYNKSDKPKPQGAYDIKHLLSDVDAIIANEKRQKAFVVGHDWGGFIAWNFAAHYPDKTEGLIIVNLPHPRGLTRELQDNPEQFANSQYARDFQKPDAYKNLSAEGLAQFVGRDAVAQYTEAFNRSSLEGMMNYYKQNYPVQPYQKIGNEFPRIKCPVLQFHGLKDTALHRDGLNGTWDWVDRDYTLVSIPQAGHWSHIDNPKLVTQTISRWLGMRVQGTP